MKKQITEHTYPTVFKFLSQDQDVTIQDILNDMHAAGLTEDDLPIMEAALFIYPEYIEGLPFPDENAKYAARLKQNTGLQLLQKFMDFWA